MQQPQRQWPPHNLAGRNDSGYYGPRSVLSLMLVCDGYFCVNLTGHGYLD